MCKITNEAQILKGDIEMIKLHRLKNVLSTYRNIVLKTMDERDNIEHGSYDDFIDEVMDQYTSMWDKDMGSTLNKEHQAYSIVAIALYKVLTTKYNVSKKNAIELIHVLTFKAAEQIFEDMSFVQMAYYLMCNKPYLRQLILRSLTEFEMTDMVDHLEEYELDEVLNYELKETNLNTFFEEQGVPELILLNEKVDAILEEFVEAHFTKNQKSFSIDDLF